MALGDKHEVKRLLEDIKELGYPEIIAFHHGGRIHMPTWAHEIIEFGIMLFGGESSCFVSTLGEAHLEEEMRPDNVIVRCKKCYAVVQEKTGERMFTLYWPEGREWGES